MDKEQLRQKRKESYQKAKAQRDADPLYQALKEKMKESSRKKYRAFRDKKKFARLEEKRKIRSEKDVAMMSFLKFASELKKPETSNEGNFNSESPREFNNIETK